MRSDVACLLLLATVVLTGPSACVDDSDDRQPGVITLVERDGAVELRDVATDFDLSSVSVTLQCRERVVSKVVTPGFVVRIQDEQGRPPPTPMRVNITPNGGTIGAAREGGGNTDERGEVPFSYAAPHFDVPTTVTLKAELVQDGQILATGLCTVDVLTHALQFIAPSSLSQIAYGRPVPLVLELFAFEGSSPLCARGGGIVLSVVGGIDAGFSRDARGAADSELCLDVGTDLALPRVWFHGGTAGGPVFVRAKVAGDTVELPLRATGAPVALNMNAEDAKLPVHSVANVTARVVDDVGQPVSGVSVTFELVRCAGGDCSDGQSVLPASATTDGDGVARTSFFSGSAPGAVQILASVRGRSNELITGSIALRVEPEE